MAQQHQQHQEAGHQPRNQPSDSLRVTPEEVALAAAALEEKRDAEHRWREETLPLEEAIQQLGLNATPDDLMPEVKAIRGRRAARAALESMERSIRRGLIFGSAALIVVVAALAWMLIQSKRTLHAMLHPVGALPLQALGTVPENRPIHLDAVSLSKLADGIVTPNQVMVDTRQDTQEDTQRNGAFDNEWTIVKSSGQIFVRVWTGADQAVAIANNQAADVFSSRPPWMPAANLVSIQVPLYRFESANLDFAKAWANNYTSYSADGKQDAAKSVLEATTIQDTDKAVIDLVESKVHDLDPSIAASAQGNTITLGGGDITDSSRHQRARQIAMETLRELGVSYKVSNGWQE